jgi:protein arginine N-methyltransferase 3
MIQDTVRTSSYAKFILSNPLIFRGAVVLDVGCGKYVSIKNPFSFMDVNALCDSGTGILSLFAARAGARRVIAIDASEVAVKAMQIVKENGMEDIITFVILFLT